MSDEDDTPELITLFPRRSEGDSGSDSRSGFVSGDSSYPSSVSSDRHPRYYGVIPSPLILNRIFERRTRRSRSAMAFRPLFESTSQFELNGYLTSELDSRYWALGAPMSIHSFSSDRSELASVSSTSIMLVPVRAEYNDGFSYVGGEDLTPPRNMPAHEGRSILGAAYERHVRSRTPPQYVPTRDIGTPRSAALTLPASRQTVAGQFGSPPAEASFTRLPYPSDIAEALLHVEFVTRPWIEANPGRFSRTRKPRRPRSDSI